MDIPFPTPKQQDVEGVNKPGDVWTQAAAEVLAALQQTRRFTDEQRKAMTKAEAGFSARQKFVLRLNVLAQLAKR